MFEKLRQSRLMFWSVELLVIATLIFVSSEINFIFTPIATFFSTLFSPILIAGFLFYLLNPLVKLIMKIGLSRNKSIGVVFLLLLGILALLIGAVIPNLIKQFTMLLESLPSFIKSVETSLNHLMSDPLFKEFDLNRSLSQLDISIGTVLKSVLNGVSASMGSVVSKIASITVVTLTAPFVLFYMLKDGHKFVPAIQKYLPEKHADEVSDLLTKMGETISSYISGQVIECIFVATATAIGYWIAGIEYAFLFGCIAGITNIIPYIGPYLGLAPAVIVTVFNSPFKALLACIVVLVVQQLDGNIIYPNVIGKSLDIHPLTIILILLVAGNLAGLMGMILAVPFYAVCKTIFIYLFDIYQLNKKAQQQEESE